MACIALALLAPLAFAAGGNGSSGPGGGGSGGGGSNNAFSYVCGDGGFGYQKNGSKVEKFFEATFVRCGKGNTAATWPSDARHEYCNTGELVYRFYSRSSSRRAISSTFAWTRSRANYEACVAQTPIYFAPHPGDVPKQTVGSVWKDNTAGRDYKGRIITKTRDGRVTTGAVEKYVGDCRAMQNGVNGRPASPVGMFYERGTNGQYKPELAQGRQLLFNAYKSWAGVLGAWGGLSAVDGAAGPIPGNADQLRFGDGLSCSSDYDFVTDETKEAPVVYGYCWIPLENRARLFRNANNSNNSRWAYFLPNVGGGERVATATNNYAKRAGQSQYNPWRDIIRADFSTITNIGAPYDKSKNIANNRDKPFVTGSRAGASAASNAVCAGGEAATANTENSTVFTAVPDHLELVVDMDKSFQVGGDYRPASLSVSQGGLYCKPTNLAGKVKPGVPPVLCSSLKDTVKPTLQKLYYGVDVKGTSDYVRCTTKTKAGACDFVANTPSSYTTHAKGKPGVKGVDKAVNMVNGLKFYSATMPDEELTVRLTGGADNAGRPYATVLMPQYRMQSITSCPPSASWSGVLGERGQCIVLPPVKIDLPPVEVVVPITIVRSTGTPAPERDGYTWKLPVIGSTDFED